MKRFLKLIDVRPSEARTLMPFFFYTFGTNAAYMISRTAGDALFLSKIGSESLPWVYIASACLVTTASLIYARLAHRFRRDVLVGGTLTWLAVSTLALRFVMVHNPGSAWILGAVYVLADVRGALNTIQFWTLCNEIYTAEEGRRLFGLAGVGAPIAGIVCGATVALTVDDTGAANLLFVVALIELASIYPVYRLQVHSRQLLQENEERRTVEQNPRAYHPAGAINDPYARTLAFMTFIAVFVLILVEYQWKATVADVFTSPHSIAIYFAIYYAAMNFWEVLIRFFMTKWFLERFQPIVALMTLPVAVVGGEVFVLFSTNLIAQAAAMTFVKSTDAIKRGISQPASALLFEPLPELERRQAIALARGVAKPLAEAAGGVVLLYLVSALTLDEIGWVIFIVTVIWALYLLYANRAYAEEMGLVIELAPIPPDDEDPASDDSLAAKTS